MMNALLLRTFGIVALAGSVTGKGFLQDVAHSLRMFRRSPGFTLAAVAAVTLGIGMNTAIFTVANAVLLKPVPFPNPDRLVMLMVTSRQGSVSWASPARFALWRTQTSVIQDVSAFRTDLVNLTDGDKREQLRAGQVSTDYFSLFGAPILQGRTFSADEDRPNGDKVVVLSHGLWARRFGSDPHVIGRTISLGGGPYVVIGVIGPTFNVVEFGPQPELWTPFQLDPNSSDQENFFEVAARLKPGVTLDRAKARLQLSANEFRTKFPTALDPKSAFSVTPFQEALVKDVRASLLILVGAVSLVLLIACANVANLLLVRAGARQREIAIRSAIGASRGRLLRQLLAESVVLSLAGGGCGLALGATAIRALLAVNTADLPRLGENGSAVRLDWRVLIFTLLVSLGTGIVVGLFPALRGSRADLNTALKEGGGPSGTASRHNGARSLLVVAEVALAVILLVGSALLIRTSIALRSVDPGFDAHHILTMRIALTGTRFRTSAGVSEIVHDVTERLNALPGVEVASATSWVPLQGGFGLPFVIAGRPLGDGPYHGQGGWFTVSPGYFEVFKIPVKRGRTFVVRDDRAAPPVVIINESMAKVFWKDGSDPMNERLVIAKGLMRAFDTEPARQIVGIVADSRDDGLNRDPGPMMFVPQAQLPDAVNITPMVLVVRTRGEPSALSGAIQEQIRQVTGLPVSDVRTMDEIVLLSTSRERFNMLLMMVFGGSALLLAAIGIYGVMAYSVAQRTQEIGIRLALGADGSAVRRMMMLQGMRLAVIGVVSGLVSAYGLTRFIASFLFGVKALDPLVFASIPVLLTGVALLAVWVPAQRASRVDPVIALRSQ
jgi:putative ABC transport system permease protein